MTITFPNGAGYHDYDDVPPQYNYEESKINIDDNVLLESESVEQGRHDHLSRAEGGRNESSLSED